MNTSRAGIQLTPTQELEREVREHPCDVNLILRLADLYQDDGRGYEAERVLERALEATGDDARIRERWEEVVIQQARRKVMMAERRAATDTSSEAKESLEQARKYLQKIEYDIFFSRCEREPENKAFRHEMGVRLQREGDLHGAMRCFEEARSDPQVFAPATLALGACQHQIQEIPKALQCFRAAAASAILPEQLGCKKLALYRAGALAVAIHLKPAAKKYWGELLQLDPQFKDVAAQYERLEKADW